jgi:nitrous oxidase accessory protein NosD
MIHSTLSNPLKKGIQIVLILLLGLATLGTGVAYASGVCVHPTGAGRCFTSIQAAVNAADDGSSILIWTGRYVEQVTIVGKNLTLIGRPGAVIQAPASMEDTLSPVAGTEGRPIVLVNNANVTIRGLTIDGANSAGTNPAISGILFINADGVIRGNQVKNIGFGTPTLPILDGEPVYEGEGIIVVNFEATPRTVTVAENWVSNYNTIGITVFAEADQNDPTLQNLTVNVLNNMVVGSGPTDALDQWGIFFGGYNFADSQFSITGTIKGNRVRDLIALDPHPLPGVGIATLSTANVEISDNTIENANIGMTANQAYGAQITNNQISGPVQNPYGSIGLMTSGQYSQISKNRFKKMETGILLFVEDAMFGSTTSTGMDDNRFDNVAMDIVTGPGSEQVALLSAKSATASGPSTADVWKRLPIRPLP